MKPIIPSTQSVSLNQANGFLRHPPMSDEEFNLFARMLYSIAGIHLTPVKKMLVTSRLYKRLNSHQLTSWDQYYQLVSHDAKERQEMLDQLTTNETYFFREPNHFDFLKYELLPSFRNKECHIWSAACSSGEEVYSLAMLLDDCLPHKNWSIQGSDLSIQVLIKAQLGHYPLHRTEGIPQDYLRKYCLKGIKTQDNTLLIKNELKLKTSFQQINLKKTLPDIGYFDIIFLRNVLIYFDKETKEEIVNRVSQRLKKNGLLIISHSENLHGLNCPLKMLRPSIFVKADRA